MANPLIKPIKKALSEIYGYKNVSVRNRSGTAWGWVEIEVTTDYEDHWDKSREVENQAIEALKKENLKPYTYCSDDGYNTESYEMLVSLKKRGGDNQ